MTTNPCQSCSLIYPLVGFFLLSLGAAPQPVAGQGLLRRLEERVRQRLEEGPIFPPPPATPSESNRPATPAPLRPVLGVEVEEVTGQNGDRQVVVTSVRPNSAAAIAGLQAEDRLVSFAGTSIRSVDTLAEIMQQSQVRDRLLMVIEREGQQINRPVTLQSEANGNSPSRDLPVGPTPSSPRDSAETNRLLPPQPGRPSSGPPTTATPPAGGGRLGLVVEEPRPTRSRRLRRGAWVVEVTPGAPGEAAGFQVGDTIVSLDGMLIPDAQTLISQMRRTRPGQRVDLQYVRDDQLRRVSVTLGGPDRGTTPSGEDQTPSSQPGAGAGAGAGTSDAATPGSPPSRSSGSVLGDVGSALGGFFGGSGPASPPAAVPPTAAAPDQKNPADPPSLPVDGEGPAVAEASPSEVLPPPSGDLPPSLASPAEEESSSAELQATIRRLETRNQQLESRLQELEAQIEAIRKQRDESEANAQ